MLILDTIGKGLTFSVTDEDLAKMKASEAVTAWAWRIALSNGYKDSHAAITAEKYPDPAEQRKAAMAMIQKKHDALVAGEVRGAVSGVRTPTDPIGKESARLARVWVGTRNNDAQIAKWAEKFGILIPDGNKSEQRKLVMAEAIRRYAARPETIAEATANVAKLSETVAVDVDL